MNVEQFWELMERTHKESGGIPERQHDLLVQALVGMSVQDIIDYDRIYEKLENTAYTTDIMNAADIIIGCGDDGFMDFRGWLIAQGKTIYENALHDPDTLADVVSVEDREQCIWESLSYVAIRAWWEKTDENEIPSSVFRPVLTGNVPLLYYYEDYHKHYPKLSAKFGLPQTGPDSS